MTAFLFPDEANRLAYIPGESFGDAMLSMPGMTFDLFLDEDATTPATVTLPDGDPLPTGYLTIDENSLIPQFLGPDGVQVLHLRYSGMATTTPLTAALDINSLQGLVEAVVSASVETLIDTAISDHVAASDPHGDRAYSTARSHHTGTQSLDTTTDSASRLAMSPAERTKLSGVASGATANSTDAQLRDRATHTGTQGLDTTTDSATRVAMAPAERTKLDGIETGATANSTDAQLRDRSTHTGTQSADSLTDGASNKVFTDAMKTKLAGIAAGATVNATDAQLRDRSTHTGEQAISTVTGLQSALDGKEASGAAASAQAYSIDRSHHTGTQSLDTTTDSASRLALTPAERSTIASAQVTTEKDQPSGYLGLTAGGAIRSQRQAPPVRLGSSMRAWENALGNSKTTPAILMQVSDSLGVYNASSAERTSWPAIVEKALMSDLGYPSAVGYISAGEDIYFSWSGLRWDTVGGTASNTGPGGSGRLLASGNYCEVTRNGDGVTIFYSKRNGGGTLTVRINGVDVGTIDTNDGAIPSGQSRSGYSVHYANSSGYQSLQVRVTSSVGSSVFDAGYFTRGNATSGVKLYRAEHGGWGFTEYLDSTNRSTLDFIERVQPHCIITNLGINDYAYHGQPSPAGMATLLTNWIVAVKAKYADPTKVSLVFAFEPHIKTAINGQVVPNNWPTDYKSALRDVCMAQGVTFLDWEEALGAYSSTNDPFDLAPGDHIHPEDAGHQMLAQPVADALRPTPVRPQGVIAAQVQGVDGEARLYAAADGSVQAFHARYKAEDLYPAAGLGISNSPFIPPGLYLGAGGSSGPDANLIRSGAGALKSGASLSIDGVFDSSAGSITSKTATPADGSVRLFVDASTSAVQMFGGPSLTLPAISMGQSSILGTGIFIGDGSAIETYLQRTNDQVLTLAQASSKGAYFNAGQLQSINAQTGTSYTQVLADGARIVTRSNASASTHTWPSNATAAIPVGAMGTIVNLGAGAVTHQAGSGATLATGSSLVQPQGSCIRWIKTATNTFSLSLIGTHASTHAATGSDPLSLTSAQITDFSSSVRSSLASRRFTIMFAIDEPLTFSTWSASASAVIGGGYASGANANTESWTYEVWLDAGTYKARSIARRSTQGPIIAFSLSGGIGSIGTHDTYFTSSQGDNVAVLTTTMVVATSGFYTLTMTNQNRNASNTTGWVMTPQVLQFIRTGA